MSMGMRVRFALINAKKILSLTPAARLARGPDYPLPRVAPQFGVPFASRLVYESTA
jgi:hypothetical protein